MGEKAAKRLQHAILSLLLAVGLSVPLLGMLDRMLISPRVAPVIAGVILLFELASLHRVLAWMTAAAAVFGVSVWVLAGNGTQILSDAALAITLRTRGIETAVPLAADSILLLVTAGITLLSCFAVMRKATCVPALLMCITAALGIWMTDRMDLIPWLLPALTAGLALLLTARFDETPAVRLLPWAAGLTAAAFLLAGSGAVVMPLKEKADEIRQAILDRLFFTEARDVFSLYAAGYSPQGPDQLGGKPMPSEHTVMQVATTKTTYLRGAIYNRYDGHGWKNTTGGRRYLWQSRRMEELRARLFNQLLPPKSVQNSLSTPVSVSVRMLSDSASTLFVPQRVRELVPGGETVPYFSNSSEIFITRNLQAGDTYEVSAPLYDSLDPGIGALTEICGTLEDMGWESIRNTYLELPSHLEQPVQDLANEVTSAADTPFEKALALQNYLSRNYRYTLDVGEHPENIDFVTSFLLDTKKGYCTYFASAMTVLCRMAGLPARYVEGYLAEPNANGEALVTGLSAHAWTEVYFKGFGWLTFDATPRRRSSEGNGSPEPGAAPSPEAGEEPTPTPEPENPDDPEASQEAGETPEPPKESPEPDKDPQESPGPDESPEPENSPEAEENPETNDPEPPEPENRQDGQHPQGSFPWWWIVLLAAAALSARCALTSPVFRERRAKTEEQRFDVWVREVTDLLRSENLVRRNGETPMAFARRVDNAGIFSENLGPAGECLSLIRYSRAVPLQTDTGLMRDTALLVRGELSRQARLKYWFRRIL
ncbi:MAG: hypothetical protein IKQ45_01240 [Clostridia bacterium]|nr:hypothetical protein [Clostridia bacterium]